MCISVGKCLFAFAFSFACLAIDVELAAAQQPAPAPPPAAMDAQTAAPARPQPIAADPYAAPADPRGAYAPAPAYPPPRRMRRGEERYDDYRAQRRPHRSRGMMIAGIALLAGGYVPPAFAGIAAGSQPRDKCDCRDALRLLIPIVGPLTLWKPDSDLNVFFNGLMVIDSLVQTTGLVLTIFGVIRYSDSVREEEDDYGQLRPKPKPALSFGAVPTPGGVYGSLRLAL